MTDLVVARPVTAADRLGPVHARGAGPLWALRAAGGAVDVQTGRVRALAGADVGRVAWLAQATRVEIRRETAVLRASGVDALLEVDDASGWWRMFGVPSPSAARVWLDVHVRGDVSAYPGLPAVLWEAVDPDWSEQEGAA